MLAGLIMEAVRFFSAETAVRELWLMVMGGVLAGIGFLVLANAGWRRVAPRLLVWGSVRKVQQKDGSW
jgi:hypothetical protein